MNTNFKIYFENFLRSKPVEEKLQLREALEYIYKFKERTEQSPFDFVWEFETPEGWMLEYESLPDNRRNLSGSCYMAYKKTNRGTPSLKLVFNFLRSSGSWTFAIEIPDYELFYLSDMDSSLVDILCKMPIQSFLYYMTSYTRRDISHILIQSANLNVEEGMSILSDYEEKFKDSLILSEIKYKAEKSGFDGNVPMNDTKVVKTVLDMALKYKLPKTMYFKLALNYGVLKPEDIKIKDMGHLF